MSVINKAIVRPIKKLLESSFRALSDIRGNDTDDYYLHEYPSYERYREVQIFHNKKKINKVWADEVTLNRVAEIVLAKKQERPIKGLCHGARNGFEQNYLNGLSVGIVALGTDISETAEDYENSVQWDFHDTKNEWKDHFDFIYTNSLDQSWQPKQALVVWLQQLKRNGILIIEHSEAHGPKGASEMDPFGVRPLVVPYVFTKWFGSQISISHSVAKKGNVDLEAWLFVISKNVEEVKPLNQ